MKDFVAGVLALAGAWMLLLCGVLLKVGWLPSTRVGWAVLVASGPPSWIVFGLLSDALLNERVAKRVPAWVRLLVGVGALLVGLFYGALGINHLILIDDCLHHGHRWDYQLHQCAH